MDIFTSSLTLSNEQNVGLQPARSTARAHADASCTSVPSRCPHPYRCRSQKQKLYYKFGILLVCSAFSANNRSWFMKLYVLEFSIKSGSIRLYKREEGRYSSLFRERQRGLAGQGIMLCNQGLHQNFWNHRNFAKRFGQFRSNVSRKFGCLRQFRSKNFSKLHSRFANSPFKDV